jgi:hypothetical protein
MEALGRNIDYFACPVADRLAIVLAATDHLVQLSFNGELMSLRDWTERNQA